MLASSGILEWRQRLGKVIGSWKSQAQSDVVDAEDMDKVPSIWYIHILYEDTCSFICEMIQVYVWGRVSVFILTTGMERLRHNQVKQLLKVAQL